MNQRSTTGGAVELDTLIGSQTDYGNEFYTYVEDDFQLGDRLKVNAGLHLSAFAVDGKLYAQPQPQPQPRLGLRYLAGDELSLKASFSTMQQCG